MTVGAAVASSPPRTAVVPRIATWHLLGALLALGTIIRIPQLQHSLNGFHGFRQTQTAFLIRKYAADGIDLLSSPLPVFGRNSDVPLEFPLFQGLGALLVRMPGLSRIV